MKNIAKVLRLLIAFSFVVALGACDEVKENGYQIDEDVKFTLSLDEVNLTSAAVRIRHNGDSDLQWVFMQTEDLTSDASVLIKERVEIELELTDRIVSRVGKNKSLELSDLEVKKYYRFIVSAIDERTGNLYGETASIVFRTQRNKDEWIENENWNVSRRTERTDGLADDTNEVVEYENFDCTSTDDESYIILTITKDDFENYEKDPEHGDVKRTLFEDYLADLSAEDIREMKVSGNSVWKEQRLRSGEYVTFMIGLDEEDNLSGLYGQFEIFVPEEQPTEDYNKWIGWWEVSFDDDSFDPWTIYIQNLDANMWLLSQGWEADAIEPDIINTTLKLYYQKNSGKVYMVSQEAASGTGGRICYFGCFMYGAYKTVLDVENIRISQIDFTNADCTEAEITSLAAKVDPIGMVDFIYGLFYVYYSPTSAMGASLAVPNFPWKMKKIEAPEISE